MPNLKSLIDLSKAEHFELKFCLVLVLIAVIVPSYHKIFVILVSVFIFIKVKHLAQIEGQCHPATNKENNGVKITVVGPGRIEDGIDAEDVEEDAKVDLESKLNPPALVLL